MNAPQEFNKFDADELARIDRLVDGELDDEPRRQLLASLDYTDGGWRRLALAFVESQVLHEDLSSLLGSDERPAPRPARLQHRSAGMVVLAMAASFAFAFCLAWIFRGAATPPDADPPIANSDPAVDPRPESPLPSAIAAGESATDSTALPADVDSGSGQDVTLVVDSGPPIELPLVHVDSGGDPWDRVERPAIPENVRRLIERVGHRVRSRRQLIPVDLQDGHRVVVPVEDIEVEIREFDLYQ